MNPTATPMNPPSSTAQPHAHSASGPLSVQDLRDFAHLVPPSGQQLLALLGSADALRLFNTWPGVHVVVPKGPCNNAGGARRWAQLVGVVGEAATLRLAQALGGQALQVPTLALLRTERRRRALRTTFDYLTAREPAGCGLSKAAAVLELCLLFAPMTARQVEVVVDSPARDYAQQSLSLFDEPI